MWTALEYSHVIIEKIVAEYPKGNFIDATLGKGYDSKFILNLPNFNGKLYCFDIQEKAIDAARKRLNKFVSEKNTHLQIIHDSHSNFESYMLQNENLHGVIFNLGYLPGGDHSITTNFSTTNKAIQQMLSKLAPRGKIIVVIYSGHPAGKIEKEKLLEMCSKLPQEKFNVSLYQFINQKNHPPMTLTIENKKPF